MASDRHSSRIEEQAAAWLVEQDRGFAPGRARDFASWLNQDERHAATFAALAQTWELMGDTRPESVEFRASPAAAGHRARRWLPLTLAAAAALAVAAVGAWRVVQNARDVNRSVTLTAATTVGVFRQVELPDGSVIQLNTDSAVEVRYQPDVRRVRLVRGEAHFSVAKNAKRPFVVGVAGVDVRVVGTVFNVRMRPDSVDVLVTEGKVRLGQPALDSAAPSAATDDSAALSELTAGHKVSVALGASLADAASAPIEVTPAEVRQALAWQAHRLDFDATPLNAIVAEFNRYNRHKLVVADSQLEAERFGGSFPADDYLTFVRILEVDFGVVAETKVGETVLRRKRP